MDLRTTHNARFMDQKVTPDVLSFISDCIINYTAGNKNKLFCVKDIWDSDYFIKNIALIFGKPSPNNQSAMHEYDKFIAQPIKTLEYSHILESTRKGRATYFKIKKLDILEFISLKDKNAFIFLTFYLDKVLRDSGILVYFENFINKAKNNKVTKNDFSFLKEKYQKFIIGNTPINGKVEVNRIFTKILNIFSVENNTFGTIKGHLSKRPIYYTDLMYNRTNFRDLEKEKKLTRQEVHESTKNLKSYEDYNSYLMTKAINFIKNKYNQSEIHDAYSTGPATYVHHIFPKNESPEIAHYLENLIKLTAEQHFTHAHPKGNTHITNKEYQLVCLLSKTESIEKSLINGEFFYSKPSLVFVINTGLKLDDKNRVKETLSFNEIRGSLKTIYKTI
jgi:hypothetical protein